MATLYLSDLIQDFLEYCEIEKGHSELTIRNYEHYLYRFLDFLEEGKSRPATPKSITLDKIRAYRLYLNHLEGLDGETMKKITRKLFSRKLFKKTFVEDEDGAVLVGELAAALEKARCRIHKWLGEGVAVGGDDDGGGVVAVGLEELFEFVEFVVVKLVDVLVELLRDAAFDLDAPVVPAVVAAAEDHGAVGVAASEADGGGGGVGRLWAPEQRPPPRRSYRPLRPTQSRQLCCLRALRSCARQPAGAWITLSGLPWSRLPRSALPLP